MCDIKESELSLMDSHSLGQFSSVDTLNLIQVLRTFSIGLAVPASFRLRCQGKVRSFVPTV